MRRLKYLKLFETFETFDPTQLDLEEPEPGYWIVYNHPKGEEMLKWLEDNLGTKENPLKEFTIPNYSKSKFYGKSKDSILLRWCDYQDRKNDTLYASHSKIWSVFKSKFKLNYNDTKLVMMWWVVETLQIRASNTLRKWYTSISGVVELQIGKIYAGKIIENCS